MYPQKIVVLSSSPLRENGEFANFESGMYLGGQIRMEAAVRLVETQPDAELIIVGGYNRDGEGDTSTSNKANDMTKFIGKHSPKTRVRTIFSLPCTYHNFVAIFLDWAQHNEHADTVGVLTNGYHMPRALEFAKRAAAEMDVAARFVPVIAENILDASISSIIGDNVQAYKKRLESERQGLAHLRARSYQDSCLTKHRDRLTYILKERRDYLLANTEMQAIC